MVGSLCEAYHWTLEEATRLTVPQIVLLNHASWVNHTNAERRYDAKHPKEGDASNGEIEKDPVVLNGKRMSQLNSDEMERYLTSWD